MEAIRKIQTVVDGEIRFQLPKQFWGREVEIIVLPAPEQSKLPAPHKKSLRGCLKHYANPDLMSQEQDVWQSTAGEKHERS